MHTPTTKVQTAVPTKVVAQRPLVTSFTPSRPMKERPCWTRPMNCKLIFTRPQRRKQVQTQRQKQKHKMKLRHRHMHAKRQKEKQKLNERGESPLLPFSSANDYRYGAQSWKYLQTASFADPHSGMTKIDKMLIDGDRIVKKSAAWGSRSQQQTTNTNSNSRTTPLFAQTQFKDHRTLLCPIDQRRNSVGAHRTKDVKKHVRNYLRVAEGRDNDEVFYRRGMSVKSRTGR